MSSNISQIFANNPVTTIADADLFYVGVTPFDTDDDGACTFATLRAALNATINVNVTGTTQAMLSNRSYTNNAASLCTYTLPATSAVGDIMEITGNGAGGWKIVFGTGQSVDVGSAIGTPTSGSIASQFKNDSIYLKCVVANLKWNTLNAPQGNLTVL